MAVHNRRRDGVWLNGKHCAVIARRLYVNIKEADKWIKATPPTPPGVTIRETATGARIQIAFTWNAKQCRELLPPCTINKASILYASNLRNEIRRKVANGSFDYKEHFPGSPNAKRKTIVTSMMETLLEKQLQLYQKQVDNGKMSPATFRGYAKSINGERMRHWHGWGLEEVTPSALRDWVSEMDCTSKAIRNMLIPLRSVFEDALNNGIIVSNPFDRIALVKLIRQTSKASDYVIQPFTQAERESILQACRADEHPTFLFWFNTGLRPGELQAPALNGIKLPAWSRRQKLPQASGQWI